MRAEKTYDVTRRTKAATWVRWDAYGCSPPRGVSLKIPSETFLKEWEELPHGKARRKPLAAAN